MHDLKEFYDKIYHKIYSTKIKEIFRENTIGEERWMLLQKLFQSIRAHSYWHLVSINQLCTAEMLIDRVRS